MPVFSKILLRTKVSDVVEKPDLIKREIVFGNVEKSIYVKDQEGNLIEFTRVEDNENTENNTWSAAKIIAEMLGQGGVVRYVFGEDVTGIINGVNTAFSTQEKFADSTLEIFLNGLRLEEGLQDDYVIDSDQTFTLNYAPYPGDYIRVNYFRKYGL